MNHAIGQPPAPTASAARAPGGFLHAAAILILAVLALQATIVSRAQPLQSANDRSRWCTVWSLLHRGSYRIDEIRQRPGWNTIDLVRVDGHFYSTKPPLMSTWVAGVTWCVERITGWRLDDDLPRVNAAVLILVNVLPFALSLWLLAKLLAQRCRSVSSAWFVLLAAAFGTLITPFLSSLNNHTVAATGVMAALYCWLRPGGTLRYAVWGFASGWAACHDLPAGAIAAWMALCAWRRDRAATLSAFVPALMVPVLAFLATNYAATGGLRPAYADYGGDRYRYVHEGVPSYWVQPQGVDRNLDSPPVYLWHCLVGHHGWFSLTPVFLLAFAGAGITRHPKSSETSDVSVVGLREAGPSESPGSLLGGTLALSVIVLGFYLTRTENYNYGGVSCGLRWMLILVPLWLITLVPALDAWATSRVFRALSLAALAVSVYSAWEPLGRPWQQPWLFRALERAGWIDYREPPPPLAHPQYSWLGALPAQRTDGERAWIEFQRSTPLGEDERLRVEHAGDERIGTRNCARVVFTRSRGGIAFSTRALRIDRDAFDAGLAPAACVVWTDRAVNLDEQQADLALFRGLPLLQAYQPGFVRYLTSPLRREALPCQRIAAQVRTTPPDVPPQIHRCDVWLCEELPFGTARIDWTISDLETAAILQQESWLVIGCHPPVAANSPVTVDHLPPFRGNP
jgi:hypothetical protein